MKEVELKGLFCDLRWQWFYQNHDINMLLKNKLSTINNYAGVPGLKSHLLTEPTSDGCIRVFEMTREQLSYIVPHSRRFDFECAVLAGSVENILFEQTYSLTEDRYQISSLEYHGNPGNCTKTVCGEGNFRTHSMTYITGEEYSMIADEIHSIKFSKGAVVLFWEKEQSKKENYILEPIVDQETIELFEVKPWMFKKV